MGNNEIKPIETVYNGYRFRSRLEARWAVFFDALGIRYWYEPEGYEGFNGEWYLPDFYLPDFDIYAEVKGTLESLDNDMKKIYGCIDYQTTPISKGLIILGQIPNYEKIKHGNIPMFFMFYWNKGACIDYAVFSELQGKIITGKDKGYEKNFRYSGKGELIFDVREQNYSVIIANRNVFDELEDRHLECRWSHEEILSRKCEKLKEAYKKARQARFEHGETPQINGWVKKFREISHLVDSPILEDINEKLINNFINKYKDLDIAFGGKENLCKIDTIRIYWHEMYGTEYDKVFYYVMKIQNYFRDAKIEFIRRNKELGAQKDFFRARGISEAMINKYY